MATAGFAQVLEVPLVDLQMFPHRGRRLGFIPGPHRLENSLVVHVRDLGTEAFQRLQPTFGQAILDGSQHQRVDAVSRRLGQEAMELAVGPHVSRQAAPGIEENVLLPGEGSQVRRGAIAGGRRGDRRLEHLADRRQIFEPGRFGLQQGLVPLRHLPVPRRENAEPASRCRDNQPS